MTARRWARARFVVALTVAGALVALLAGAVWPHQPAPSPAVHAGERAARSLPPPVPPAFTPGVPRRLGSTRELSHWAIVARAVAARSAPGSHSAAVVRLDTVTPEGTDVAVPVLGRGLDGSGRLWVRIGLPVLPNGTTGWVPRSALGGYETADTRLEVDLGALRATLVRRGRAILRAPVGVGSSASPTPAGDFLVRNRLTRYASPAYGPVAFGTSARSATATDWPAGGFVGIHGTDRPDLLPGRVSHGCIRMRNADILRLARLMPVGTPLRIR